ncbi:methylenetetrahydrofolate reductase [Sphingobium lactosutens]|uniref:methylenetetrahydrofolate reductase n=1 Tax=Sphingobium lactosutens TaxID=522773 RepID=UPI0015B92134|nr:methylenetetrahydrofolate reductase [Sphingobium lactosutens]
MAAKAKEKRGIAMFRTRLLRVRALLPAVRRWHVAGIQTQRQVMPMFSDILAHYSIEATAKDAPTIVMSDGLPSAAEVYVPYLPEESDAARIEACAMIRRAGLIPVPHISARRLTSVEALDALLGALRERAQVDRIFLIAGDLARPVGPFADSLSVISTGLIERHGIRSVGIAGHPDGHPDVAEDVIWQAMQDKVAALGARGLNSQIVTQFSFDAQQVLNWLREVRARGIVEPVRVGIPGPTGVRTLLRYATRCGVAASAGAVAKYGLSLGRLLGNAGPDRFVSELRDGLDPTRTGEVLLHIFPFGGFAQTADWLAQAGARAPGCRAA